MTGLVSRLITLLSGGLAAAPEPAPPVAETRPSPASYGVCQQQLMVLIRSSDSFYHRLTDEEFVEWLRGWSASPQVLSPSDREALLDRMRAETGFAG